MGAVPVQEARPAPELARHERVTRERQARPAEPAPPPASVAAEPRDAIAIPADILSSSKNSQASATEARARSLTDADHLATLNAIWQAETAKMARSPATGSSSWPNLARPRSRATGSPPSSVPPARPGHTWPSRRKEFRTPA
jgi:hypothetical protein